MNSVPMLQWLSTALGNLEGSNKIYQYAPEQNDPTEEGDWILDAEVDFTDQENNRLETWTFKLFWWAGNASVDKDKRYEEAWKMRDRCMEFFGSRQNWGMGGTADNSKLHTKTDQPSIGPWFHGDAIWVGLCMELEALRIIRHGD